MIRKSWRSRFVDRLVADVSKPAVERAAAHPRLFPYTIADTVAEPFRVHHRVILVPPRATEAIKPPASKQSVWHFVKR